MYICNVFWGKHDKLNLNSQQPEAEKSEARRQRKKQMRGFPRRRCGISNLAGHAKKLTGLPLKNIPITRHLGPSKPGMKQFNFHQVIKSQKKSEWICQVFLDKFQQNRKMVSLNPFQNRPNHPNPRPACTKWGLPWEASFPSANGSGAELLLGAGYFCLG